MRHVVRNWDCNAWAHPSGCTHRLPLLSDILFAAMVLIASCFAAGRSWAGESSLGRQATFQIAEQPLDTALIEFSKQAGVPVSVAATSLHRIQAPALSGTMEAGVALSKLLHQSGLRYEELGDTVTVVRESPASLRPSIRVAGAAQAPPAASSNPAQSGAGQSNQAQTGAQNIAHREVLEEVLVTAQKRTERLQDVPVPVTAINADTLVDSNQLRIQDYYTSVPGLSAIPGSFHDSPMLSIRGITTGGDFTNPTVGIVVDDVPYGSSTGLTGGGFQAPDIDPSDLARVEVLRGPQGTLYGASSIGGLLKFVTVDPSTDRVSGRVQGGVSGVSNGAGPGYSVRGAVNVPLSDTLAVRASGFVRGDPGYIDNPVLHINGINEGRGEGGRLSALWRPSQDLSLKVSALVQHNSADGSPYVDVEPGLGDLQQNNLRGTGGYRTTFQAYSATLTAKLGSIDLTSLSGYTVNSYSDSYDYTFLFGTCAPGSTACTQAQFGVTGTPLFNDQKTRKFTQELRLAGAAGPRIDWLLGAFYTHEKSLLVQKLRAEDPATGILVGSWEDTTFPSTFEEYAGFADLTFHFTDEFDIQVGGRESENKQVGSSTIVGPYAPVFVGVPSPFAYPEVDTKENSFTYLVTPRFKVSPELMVYARVTSGYRPGGPNITAALVGLPPHFSPDRTHNYEIGVKGDVLDHTLTFDASLYYIGWKDIQLNFFDVQHGVGYIANASRAKSQGVEIAAESRPLKGLTVSAWIAWNDAVLTADIPPTSLAYGVAGNRLPYSSRFSGNLSLEQAFPVTGSVTGSVGASLSYVGDRKDIFTVPPRPEFPAYAKLDLRAGVKYASWSGSFFVNNVTNRRGVLGSGVTDGNPIAIDYLQPRTIGMSLARTF